MTDPVYAEARRIVVLPQRQALEHLEDVLTWDSGTVAGSAANCEQMEYNAHLITAIREECSRQMIVPPWGR